MQSCGRRFHSWHPQPEPHRRRMPVEKKEVSNQAISELFPPPKKYCPLLRNSAQADRSALYEDLKEYGRFTGLFWLLSQEPPVTNTLPALLLGNYFLL